MPSRSSVNISNAKPSCAQRRQLRCVDEATVPRPAKTKPWHIHADGFDIACAHPTERTNRQARLACYSRCQGPTIDTSTGVVPPLGATPWAVSFSVNMTKASLVRLVCDAIATSLERSAHMAQKATTTIR